MKIATLQTYDERIARRESLVEMKEGLKEQLRCLDCGRWLVWSGRYWQCWRGHGKLIPEPLLVERLIDSALIDGVSKTAAMSGATRVVRQFREEQLQRENAR